MAAKNMRELEKLINRKIFKAIDETRKIIAKTIYMRLVEYYHEPVFGTDGNSPTPVVYKRTYKLLDAFNEGKVVQTNHGFEFKVGFEDDYLTFKYPGDPTYEYNTLATGYDVLTWYNEYSHGGSVPGTHKFWDEAIDAINLQYGSITELFKLKLRHAGLPVK